MAYVQYVDVGSLFDDIIGAGKDVVGNTVKEGQKQVEGKTSDLAEQLIRSSQFKKVLDKVEEKANAGVKKAAAANALPLAALASSAGVLGAYLLRGKVGMLGASAIAAASLFLIVQNTGNAAK